MASTDTHDSRSAALPAWLLQFDHGLIGFTRRYSLTVLRVALGIVFVWFGALKVFGVSPVADLVAKTAYFLPAHPTVVGIGMVEILIGIGLLSGFAIRVTMLLFFLQMMATFLTIVIQPHLLFKNGNPFELSVFGEFVVKNLVLVAAGLVIVSSVPKAHRSETRRSS